MLGIGGTLTIHAKAHTNSINTTTSSRIWKTSGLSRVPCGILGTNSVLTTWLIHMFGCGTTRGFKGHEAQIHTPLLYPICHSKHHYEYTRARILNTHAQNPYILHSRMLMIVHPTLVTDRRRQRSKGTGKHQQTHIRTIKLRMSENVGICSQVY